MQRGHQIDSRNIAYFRHVYDGEAADMRHLYEQAKLDQWNAATDIDWAQPLDTEWRADRRRSGRHPWDPVLGPSFAVASGSRSTAPSPAGGCRP